MYFGLFTHACDCVYMCLHASTCIYMRLHAFTCVYMCLQGFGLGGLDYYDGYVQYKLLDPSALSSEIGDMSQLIEKSYKQFSCTQVQSQL